LEDGVCTKVAVWAVAACFAASGQTVNDLEWRRLISAGAAADAAGDYRGALASFDQAVHCLAGAPAHDERLVRSLNGLGQANQTLGHFLEAERVFRLALSETQAPALRSTPLYPLMLANLGTLYVEEGQVGRGLPLVRKAVDEYRRQLDPDDPRVAAAENSLAEALLHAGKKREASEILTRALATIQKEARPNTELLVTIQLNMATIQQFEGHSEEARRIEEKMLAVIETTWGADHPFVVRPLNNLAIAYCHLGKREESDAAFRRALRVAEQSFGPAHQTYGDILATYSAFLRRNGRKSEAREAEARSKSVRAESLRRNGAGLTVDVSALK
jgi:tetratricopeptide (TPR) repeat protein